MIDKIKIKTILFYAVWQIIKYLKHLEEKDYQYIQGL